MSWVKIDDGFYDHPKVMALLENENTLGYAALGLFTLGLSYCGRHLTDGFVPAKIVKGVRRLADLLVRYGFWVIADGGYGVHDYLQRNPSRAQVEADRERVKNWKRTRTLHVPEHVENPSRPVPVPIPEVQEHKDQETASPVSHSKRTASKVVPAVIRGPLGFVVATSLLERWRGSYPGVDIDAEVRAAFEWEQSDPKNHRPRAQMFLVNWLKKAYDKLPRVPEKIRPDVLNIPEITPDQAAANRAKLAEMIGTMGQLPRRVS